jgi:hypothetical protein
MDVLYLSFLLNNYYMVITYLIIQFIDVGNLSVVQAGASLRLSVLQSLWAPLAL